MGEILVTVLLMAFIGLVAALLLYMASKKFYVYEDPRISEVEDLLPGANCGSCGYSGCHAFAVACCTADSLEGINCPGAGSGVMADIGRIVGLAAEEVAPKVAVLACNGSCSLRPAINNYTGIRSCALEASLFAGSTACAYGCLGCGDCVSACPYDAIHMDVSTGLPSVDYAKCVGCGRCSDACPRGLLHLEDKRRPMVWVACSNHDKGGQAMKECEVACIGCGKCMKTCPANAIKVSGFVAAIDQSLCTACGACMEVCPRHSILSNQIIKADPS